jgi:hypothetical protein
MVDIKRLAMRMKLHKVGGSPVHHCAILAKQLAQIGIATKMVKGYCVSPGDVCEHYWVRTRDEGLDLDIALALATLYAPELGDMKTMLLEELPEELKSVEVQKAEESANLFDLYNADPKTFWDESPLTVRTFKP